jgi:hypothetical protein
VVLASLTSVREKAKISKVVAEINQLRTALELYRNDNGEYPPDQNRLFVLGDILAPKYMGSKSFLKDSFITGTYYWTGYNMYHPERSYPEDDVWWYECGGKIPQSYILLIYSEIQLNLPMARYYYVDTLGDPGGYCIGV